MARRRRKQPRGAEFLKREYNDRSTSALKGSLVEVFRPGSGASNSTKGKVTALIGKAAVNELRRLESTGTNIFDITRKARDIQSVIERIESRQLSSRPRFYLLMSHGRISEVLSEMRQRAGLKAHPNEAMKQHIVELAAQKGARGLRNEINRLVTYSMEEAISSYQEGNPSKSFATPLIDTIKFFERLERASPPGLSKSMRGNISKKIEYLKKYSSPIELRARIDWVNNRRQVIEGLVKKAANLDEVAGAEKQLWHVGFDQFLDRKTIDSLSKSIERKRKKISKEVIGRIPKKTVRKREVRDGFVWLGQWVQTYRVQKLIEKAGGKFEVLAGFKKHRSAKPIGKAAVRMLKHAWGEYLKKHGKRPNTVQLLKFIEESGK